MLEQFVEIRQEPRIDPYYYISKIELKNQLPCLIPLEIDNIMSPEDVRKFKEHIISWSITKFPAKEEVTNSSVLSGASFLGPNGKSIIGESMIGLPRRNADGF